MAPEPGILKRQRSRPSDWWAAKPATSPTVHVPQSAATAAEDRSMKERKPMGKGGEKRGPGRPPFSGLGIKEKMAAGNRGRKEKGEGADPESSEKLRTADKEQDKPPRRGRSSAGEADIRALGVGLVEAGISKATNKKVIRAPEGSNVAVKEKPSRRGRSSAGEADLLLGQTSQAKDTGDTKVMRGRKRGRPATVVAKEVPADETEEHVLSVGRGRPSGARAREQNDEPVDEQIDETTAPKRRSRRSFVAVEDQIEKESAPGDAREESGPRKRGRPPLAPTGEYLEEQLPKASKKRGRPAAVGSTVEIASEDSGPKSRRTRRSDAEVFQPEAESVSTENTPARGRTRHRQSDVGENVPSQPKEKGSKRRRDREPDEQVEDTRRTRRTRRSDKEPQQVIQELSAKRSGKSNKSQRRSEVVAVETASSKLTKIRGQKGSKPASSTSQAKKASSSPQTTTKAKKAPPLTNASSSALSQQSKKGSKRASRADLDSRKRKGIENTEPAPSKRQRTEKSPENIVAEVDLLNYQHLKAVTRNVSRQTIEAKWEALPPAAIDRIAQLLSDLQRPVIARLNDEKKKTQASTAVEAVSRKLLRKISRGLPFPPGTRNHREDDFDFEKILDHNRALETQLTPALHSNELLEAELSKELAKLEADRELLAELETNAKAEASVRNQAARKLRTVLQTDESSGEMDLLNDNIGLNVDQQSQSLNFGAQDDENLRALVEELDGHVDSIQSNIKQVQGISQAMAKSRAAVQATLFDHLDNSLYDDVVLGAEEGVQ